MQQLVLENIFAKKKRIVLLFLQLATFCFIAGCTDGDIGREIFLATGNATFVV